MEGSSSSDCELYTTLKGLGVQSAQTACRMFHLFVLVDVTGKWWGSMQCNADVQRHLIPGLLREHGLGPDQLLFPAESLQLIADGYTREASHIGP